MAVRRRGLFDDSLAERLLDNSGTVIDIHSSWLEQVLTADHHNSQIGSRNRRRPPSVLDDDAR